MHGVTRREQIIIFLKLKCMLSGKQFEKPFFIEVEGRRAQHIIYLQMFSLCTNLPTTATHPKKQLEKLKHPVLKLGEINKTLTLEYKERRFHRTKSIMLVGRSFI